MPSPTERNMCRRVSKRMTPAADGTTPLELLPDCCADTYAPLSLQFRQHIGIFVGLVPPPRRPSAPCLRPRPVVAAMNALPPLARDMLEYGNGDVMCAGGRILGAVVNDDDITGDDTDLWVVNVDKQRRSELAWLFVTLAEREGGKVVRSARALTATVRGERVQLVLQDVATIEDVLQSFDLLPCKVGLARQNGTDPFSVDPGDWCVWVVRGWRRCVMTRSFPVMEAAWTAASPLRICKYALKKKFTPWIAGLDRRWANDRLAAGAPEWMAAEWEKGAVTGLVAVARGAQKLLALERVLQGCKARDAKADLFAWARGVLKSEGDQIVQYDDEFVEVGVECVPQLEWHASLAVAGGPVGLREMRRDLVVPRSYECFCGRVVQDCAGDTHRSWKVWPKDRAAGQ